jgi:hypothetical protein
MEVPTGHDRRSRLEQYRLFVGIDWATEKHQVCIVAADGDRVSEREVEHRGPALEELAEALLKAAQGRPEHVAVGIEVPHGAVVEFLEERGFHVYAINPKQLDRFRDGHSVAGAKDDRLDAYVLAESLRTKLSLYRRVQPREPLMIQIREASRAWEDVKEEGRRLSNQLRDLTYRLVPQILTLSPATDEPWIWDLLELLANGTAPERVRPTQIQRILKVNRIRRFEAEEILVRLREQAPWTTPGTREAVRGRIKLLLPRLRVTLEQTREAEKQVTALLEEGEKREHRDIQILQSLPGGGKVVIATMLAEASQPLAERQYQTLRTLSGIAAVTKRSGKQLSVHMRYACNERLRNAFHYWAQAAKDHDDVAKARYVEHRKAGQSHGRALRSVAERLLRVLMAMLKAGTLYDPTHSANRRLAAVAP